MLSPQKYYSYNFYHWQSKITQKRKKKFRENFVHVASGPERKKQTS